MKFKISQIAPLIIVSMALVLSGCNQTKYVYVVHRDTPVKPVFTVVGTFRGASDIKLASDAEAALIRLGISVISPPISKSVTKQTGGIDATSSQGSDDVKNSSSKGELTSDGVTEEYRVLSDTRADYVIFVNSVHNTFKVVKKVNQEILTVGNSDMFNIDYDVMASADTLGIVDKKYKIYDTFTALGLKVKKPTEPRPSVEAESKSGGNKKSKL